MASDPFDEFFSKAMRQLLRELEEIEKGTGKLENKGRFPKFIVRGPGRAERQSGFSINISSDGTSPPRIEMRRFGPGGEWEKIPVGDVAPSLKRQMPATRAAAKPRGKTREVKEKVIPEYNVSIDVNEVTIKLNARGVEDRGNVRTKFYPESVEIYATSPKLDRGYFCTVAIPASVDRQRTTIDVEKERVIVRIPRTPPQRMA